MMGDGAGTAAIRVGGGLASYRVLRLGIRRLGLCAGLPFLLRLLLVLIGAVVGGWAAAKYTAILAAAENEYAEQGCSEELEESTHISEDAKCDQRFALAAMWLTLYRLTFSQLSPRVQ
jgi:hypothetical protein